MRPAAAARQVLEEVKEELRREKVPFDESVYTAEGDGRSKGKVRSVSRVISV